MVQSFTNRIPKGIPATSFSLSMTFPDSESLLANRCRRLLLSAFVFISPFVVRSQLKCQAVGTMSLACNPAMHLRCPFCGVFLPLLQMQSHCAHANGCPSPLYTPHQPLWCFTCGISDTSEFSATQLAHAAQVGCTRSRGSGARFARVLPIA
jgi:hypothetical protein